VTVVPPPLWKRPRVIIPVAVVIASVALVAVLAVAVSRYQASRDAKAAKAAAAEVVAPFVKLDTALEVGVNFEEYGSMVRDCHYALDGYKPAKSDMLGLLVQTGLITAMLHYEHALDRWNNAIGTTRGVDSVMPDIRENWGNAGGSVARVKDLVDNGLPPGLEKIDPSDFRR